MKVPSTILQLSKRQNGYVVDGKPNVNLNWWHTMEHHSCEQQWATAAPSQSQYTSDMLQLACVQPGCFDERINHFFNMIYFRLAECFTGCKWWTVWHLYWQPKHLRLLSFAVISEAHQHKFPCTLYCFLWFNVLTVQNTGCLSCFLVGIKSGSC